MNNNQEVLYKEVKSRIDSHIVQMIIGKTISNGISNYYAAKSSNKENIDYAEILIESLGPEILDNEEFIRIFVRQCISEEKANELSKLLFIDEDQSTYAKGGAILSCSKNKRKEKIIELYELEGKYFEKSSLSAKVVTHEKIIPYTPIPIDDEDNRSLIPKEFLSLHDYQKRIKDRTIQKLLFEVPNQKMLIHMPTGSGKTKTSIEAIIDFIRVKTRAIDGGGSVIWFANSRELCEQAYSTFNNMWRFKGDYEINTYKIFGDADYNVLENCINNKVSFIFIGFQKFHSLLQSNSVKARKIIEYLGTNTKLAIVDEAHRSLANTYKESVEFVTSMPDCRLIGLTATPGRSNFIEGDSANSELSDFFGGNIIRITDEHGMELPDPLKYLQEEKVLANINQVDLEAEIDLTKLDETFDISLSARSIDKNGDVGSKELNLIATDPFRNSLIIENIKEHYELGNSILVFACSKDHCIILERILTSIEIENNVIIGETNKAVRKKAIDDFKNKKLKVIINYGVLSTGFDAPKLNTLIIARTTKSIVLYSQMIGRALRGPKNGGNELNTLITIKDNLKGFPEPDFMFKYWNEFWN